jgi:hypothetical protein
VIDDARDPSASGDLVAWQSADGAVLAREGSVPEVTTILPGTHPALGGALLAWAQAEVVHVVRAADLSPVADVTAAGADALAVGDEWLVFRRRLDNAEELIARRLPDGPEQGVIGAEAPLRLGRPALSGSKLVFHVAGPRRSRIDEVDLATMARRTLRSSTLAQLTNPSLDGETLIYVRTTNTQQQLTDGRRILHRAPGVSRRDSGFERGHSHGTRTPPARPPSPYLLWTTALSPHYAYVTLASLNGGPSSLVQLRRDARYLGARSGGSNH